MRRRPGRPKARAALHVAITVVVALPLAACATSNPPKLAVCDGKHRRDANPYGTVLPGAPAPASLPVPDGKHPPSLPPPPPPPASDKTSAIAPLSFPSC